MLKEEAQKEFEILKHQYSALEKSENSFREIIAMLPETVFETDSDKKITFVNDAGLKLFGYSSDDLKKGLYITDLFAKEEGDKLQKNFKLVLDSEKTDSTAYMARKKDGKLFHVLVHSRVIIKFGKPIGVRGMLFDNTKYFEIHRELKRERDFIKSLLNTANSMIVCLDKDENIIDFNKECERITGYSSGEVIGKNWPETFIPVNEQRVSDLSFAEWVEKHPEDRREGKIKTKTGEIRTILWSNSSISRSDSDEIVAIAIGHDITERIRAEKAIAESEERYRAVWDNIPVGICLTDKDGVYHDVNPAYCKIYGYKKEDLVGKMPEGLIFPPVDLEKRRQHYNERFDLEKPTPLREHQFFKSNGERVWIEVTSDFIRYDNKPKYLISMNIDITERKKAEEALGRSEKRLAAQYSNFPIPTYSWKKIDDDFILIDYNKEACKITDGKIGKLIGIKFGEFYAENSEFIADIWQCYNNKTPVKKEILYNFKSTGKEKYLAVEYVYVPDDLVMVHTEDITDRKIAIMQLVESEERYRLLFENAGESIFSVDANGVFKMINKMAASYLGGVQEDFVGKTMWDLFPKNLADRQMANVLRTLQDKEPKSYEEETIINNEIKWFRTSIFPIDDLKTKIPTVLVVAHDITEKHNLKTKMAARFQLLDNLRHSEKIDECLEFGCVALKDARLFKRAVLTLHNEKREITNIGFVGIDKKLANKAKEAKAPGKELSKKIIRRKFKISHSYFIPEEAGMDLESTERYIPPNNQFKIKNNNNSWRAGDELFVPISGTTRKFDGWLSVDTSFDGNRPTIENVMFLEEIIDIVMQRVREIRSKLSLDLEREALQEKNITLKEVLGHIEEEKAEFKQRITENIQQILIPTLNRLANESPNIGSSFVNILKTGLNDLTKFAGGITQTYIKLSPREIEICNFLRNGSTSKEIAKTLKISLATVQKHRETIRKKLGLKHKSVNLISYLKKQ